MNCAATRVAAPGSRVAPRVRLPRSGHLTAREGAGPGCWDGAAGDSGSDRARLKGKRQRVKKAEEMTLVQSPHTRANLPLCVHAEKVRSAYNVNRG